MIGESLAAAADPVGAPDAALLCREDLAGFLAEGEPLEDWLEPVLPALAAALEAGSCALLLLSNTAGTPALVAAARSGPGSEATDAEAAEAALYSGLALSQNVGGRSVVCAPVRLRGRPLGVLVADRPAGCAGFDARSVALAELVAGLLARVVQAAQLQRILDLRFAQIALAETGRRHAGIMQRAMPPDRAAQIVARSLFRQMRQAGFSDKQVIRTASEILDELHRSLRRSAARTAST